jgi:Holliday junction resolvasome RuvABC endonuclease subunit
MNKPLCVVGIDYSISSPAICIHFGDTWHISNCEFHFFQSLKKHEDFIVHGLDTNKFVSYPSQLKDDKIFSQTEKYDFISDWAINTFISEAHSSDIIVFLEGYAFGASKGSLPYNIAENTGLLKYKLFTHNIPVTTVQPTTVKKYATSKGNASKILLEETFEREHNMNLRRLFNQTDKQFNPSSDIIDAYYICSYGFDSYISSSPGS